MTQPTAANIITCAYGVPGTWMAGYHTGIDYQAPVGTEIFATRGGRVVHAGTGGSYGPSYGKYVVVRVRFRGRTRQVLYAHLSSTKVRVGQYVRAGDTIGFSGDTGNTRGAHLHYEERVSPFNYWSHYKPVLPTWEPRSRKLLNTIFSRIGLKKRT